MMMDNTAMWLWIFLIAGAVVTIVTGVEFDQKKNSLSKEEHDGLIAGMALGGAAFVVAAGWLLSKALKGKTSGTARRY